MDQSNDLSRSNNSFNNFNTSFVDRMRRNKLAFESYRDNLPSRQVPAESYSTPNIQQFNSQRNLTNLELARREYMYQDNNQPLTFMQDP